MKEHSGVDLVSGCDQQDPVPKSLEKNAESISRSCPSDPLPSILEYVDLLKNKPSWSVMWLLKLKEGIKAERTFSEQLPLTSGKKDPARGKRWKDSSKKRRLTVPRKTTSSNEAVKQAVLAGLRLLHHAVDRDPERTAQQRVARIIPVAGLPIQTNCDWSGWKGRTRPSRRLI